MTIEAIILLLSEKKLEWLDLKKLMGKSDFIENILNFKINNIKEKTINIIKSEYLNSKEWDLESIY